MTRHGPGWSNIDQVVWFQRHRTFPIEEEAVKAIQAIDWAGCAGDFNY